jgi:hypothetical protein
MMFGKRYREWKRTGELTPIPPAAFWMLIVAAACLALVWWLSR